jgi:hypothetical protein
MIIAFIDDGTLEVFPDIVSVRDQCEAIDVEEGAYHFFDECGRSLRPRIITPVRRTSLPFGVKLMGGGNFDLELAPEIEEGAFDTLLESAIAIEPNQWFASISDLRQHVAQNRRS